VHAILLSPQYSPHLIERAGAVLNATLRPLATVEAVTVPVPAALAVAPVRPLPATPAPARAEQFSVPAPSPVAVLAARPAGSRPKEVQSTLGVPTFPPASMAGSDTAKAAESAGAVTAGGAKARGSALATGGTSGGAGAGAGIDADGLRQYRLALAREARRFKRYPERAMLAGIGGTAQVRIDIAADGGVLDARLAGSSGNDSLDAAAVAMVRQAAPRALLPETLRGRAFPVTLPVIFDPAAD